MGESVLNSQPKTIVFQPCESAEPTVVKLSWSATPAAELMSEIWSLFTPLALSGRIKVLHLLEFNKVTELVRVEFDGFIADRTDAQAFRLEPTEKLRELVEALRALHRQDEIAELSHGGPCEE